MSEISIPKSNKWSCIQTFLPVIPVYRCIQSVTVLQLLRCHQDEIAPDHNDPLIELLEDLGDVPTVAELLGKERLSPVTSLLGHIVMETRFGMIYIYVGVIFLNLNISKYHHIISRSWTEP